MARITVRQTLRFVSTVWLIALTITAIMALYLLNEYSLPMNTFLAALAVGLPPMTGIAMELYASMQIRASYDSSLRSPKLFLLLYTVLLALDVMLATLVGTHIGPQGGRLCPAHEKWQSMMIAKEADKIKRIQDGMNCCGFNSPRDMAYPFPDARHGADACIVRYDRHEQCAERWIGMERKMAIMLLVVPIGLFLWKLALYLVREDGDSWLPSTIALPDDPSDESVRSRRAQRPALTFPLGSDEEDIQQETRRLNEESALASHVEGAREARQRLSSERDNIWDEEH